MQLKVRGELTTTTATEFRLLDYLARHPGRVFSRDHLLDAVWGDARFVTPRSVDVYVRRIREKIEIDPENPRYLKTVRGAGYRFETSQGRMSASVQYSAFRLVSCFIHLVVRRSGSKPIAQVTRFHDPKVFTKLLALFILLLVFHTLVMEMIFRRFCANHGERRCPAAGREALWSGLIALAVAMPLAAWAASRITARLERVVAFARRIAGGDLSARIDRAAMMNSPPWRPH